MSKDIKLGEGITTAEKLQLIDHLRVGFANAVLDILKDEEEGLPISVDIHFYSTYHNPKLLLEAAKELGWEYEENNSRWYHGKDELGKTTIFFH